ncbi:hypothetical protein PVAND_009743 [Polypedilum vanderplanki]|uniref:Ionotropic receptor n=1 Tax=Polypedilum vanderplanki TaxID=319348 RepID=A0A9J6CDR7_POLVA|nr:hypothetical protein PVAND_009743 [Polypedilum vanderplanki]
MKLVKVFGFILAFFFMVKEIKCFSKNKHIDNNSIQMNYSNIKLYKNLQEQFERSQAISQALTDVIHVYLIQQRIYFNVTIMNPMSKSYSEIVDITLGKIKKFHSNYLMSADISQNESIKISYSSIFFADESMNENSSLKLKKLIKVLSTDPRKLKFLTYKETCVNITSIKNFFHEKLTFYNFEMYLYIVCKLDDKTLKLVTHEWFDYDSCNKRKLKTLNSFDLKSKKWKNKLMNHQKFRNFNKCLITIRDTGFNSVIYSEKNIYKFKNVYEKFWLEVAKYANFSLNLMRNGTKNINLDLYMGPLTTGFSQRSVTSVFSSMDIGLMVTRGKAYNDYEKLLMPFDLTTWILLFFTFGIAFFVIFIINQMSIKIQEKVFGRNITTPSFNVVSTFFGIGLSKLPKTSFARFILIMFIMFCLIVRTAYQGVIFDYMNSDMRKPHATTIEEVFEQNYRVLSQFKSHIANNFKISIPQKWWNKIEYSINPFKSGKDICKHLLKDEPKTAIVTCNEIDRSVFLGCNIKPIRIKETVFTIPSGFGMQRNHYLYEVIEEVLKPMIESGILKHMSDYSFWLFSRRYNENKTWPKVLALGDLSYGFNIWLITCSFAIVVFFWEIITWRIKKRKKSLTKFDGVELKEIKNNDIVFEELENETSLIDLKLSNKEKSDDQNVDEEPKQLDSEVNNIDLLPTVNYFEFQELENKTKLCNESEKEETSFCSENSLNEVSDMKKSSDMKCKKLCQQNSKSNEEEIIEIIDLE